MYSFGERSLECLTHADHRLVRICNRAIKIINFSVIESFRDEERQNHMYRTGRSKLKWPNSKHNTNPSRAIDIVPYPLDWGDEEQFIFQAGVFIGIGNELNTPVRWGGDWNRNGVLSDNRFNDLPHLELVDR